MLKFKMADTGREIAKDPDMTLILFDLKEFRVIKFIIHAEPDNRVEQEGSSTPLSDLP